VTRGARGRSRTAAKGIYANYFEVGHTAFEFVLDFGESYASRDPRCHTRIVTSPTYAQALLATLSKAVGDYQEHADKRGKPGARRNR
jgi:hypothetical protein